MSPRIARRVLVGVLTASSFAVTPALARSDGFFNLPAGDTFTLSNTYLWGCDPLSYGYKLGDEPKVVLGDNSAGPCDQITQPDVTVGPFTTARMFRVYLQDADTAPPFTFLSNNPRHTSITGSKHDWQIQIGDSDFGTAPPSVVYHAHNLSTTLTIGGGCTAAPTAPDAHRDALGGRPTPDC